MKRDWSEMEEFWSVVQKNKKKNFGVSKTIG